MKSLKEQISDKCIHFNGIMNKCCKAGVNYDDVKVDRPFKFPCLKQGGECSLSTFPSPEEAERKERRLNEQGGRAMKAYAAIKKHYSQNKERTAAIRCSCGARLTYVVSLPNDHIWASCSKCKLSFGE